MPVYRSCRFQLRLKPAQERTRSAGAGQLRLSLAHLAYYPENLRATRRD
jgi:hypothetical protein